MANFFTDNKDILFHFNRFKLQDIVKILENDYKEREQYKYAPENYNDAVENFYKVLEIVGDLSANFIAPRAAEVDNEGAHFHDGKVEYAKGTKENLEVLSKADLMGMTIPRKYGGLNLPHTIYLMAIEMISRADASLMNIYGLQDIAVTINKFGSEAQKEEFIPKFTTGEYTGAMALTEPDAGSDLQAVKCMAYQDEHGQWRLRGVKRFITNGNANVLLVLARSEQGTKDGRGLSMFVCYGDETVKIRRIEHKLGINGSPTCEIQFNDTPCQLVGQRKFGLIKYVMDLMNSARIGVAAQALGISQAAYEEALQYAKEREQFGKPIIALPVISNMLIDMRVTLETNRSLFYSAVQSVDRKEALELLIERLKEEGKSTAEENLKLKQATKVAALLTPVTKYFLTEAANQIAYDALQIHGGTGYMKEFRVERLTRDARITNIYEGTSQLQIVAAIGGVINDVLADFFEEHSTKNYPGNLTQLSELVKEIRNIYIDAKNYVTDKKDTAFFDTAAKYLVEIYTFAYVGYLVLDEAIEEQRKVFIANRYIKRSLAKAKEYLEMIKNDTFVDIIHTQEILG
ncbi:MAG TPA: acyl-CoA dehydrogenase family protein [Ignavibacteriales bacterium]|nr:acyl-CoA dehydrogenase family protein [Ignavibacteriales bacterium]HOL81075.1 acyl-CoA dehydrogenase family protein [Ignavibacteriales bacterium]HOM66328.1 acyl-CoA dehydrogenase family protein [Ignavibacteriales bacterium]HPD68501.1 acyl-CoA dehydrogenase family protein [Ignavibacteriales bacterium]HPP32856.1 acyl-CoA dehydrogenase family protein [Ignavibacteriales bacterium]